MEVAFFPLAAHHSIEDDQLVGAVVVIVVVVVEVKMRFPFNFFFAFKKQQFVIYSVKKCCKAPNLAKKTDVHR